jgi:uncharacterized coiled-coil protein SlyX
MEDTQSALNTVLAELELIREQQQEHYRVINERLDRLETTPIHNREGT